MNPDINPIDILRLLSELEGSYQLLKHLGFEEDMLLLESLKGKYYKMYFQLKKKSEANVAPLV